MLFTFSHFFAAHIQPRIFRAQIQRHLSWSTSCTVWPNITASSSSSCWLLVFVTTFYHFLSCILVICMCGSSPLVKYKPPTGWDLALYNCFSQQDQPCVRGNICSIKEWIRTSTRNISIFLLLSTASERARWCVLGWERREEWVNYHIYRWLMLSKGNERSTVITTLQSFIFPLRGQPYNFAIWKITKSKCHIWGSPHVLRGYF